MIKSKTRKRDRKKLKSLAECKDKNDVVLKRKKFKEVNPYPYLQPPYKIKTIVYRDGVILTDGNNEIKKIKKHSNKIKMHNKNNKGKTKNINKQQGKEKHFQSKFDKIFGNDFPFKNGNPFDNECSSNNNQLKQQQNQDHEESKSQYE